MSETADEKAIRIISFSGKKVDWPVWKEKFLVRPRRKGYQDLLKGKELPPSNDSSQTKKTRCDKLNESAYKDIVLSIDAAKDAGRVAFQIVKGSKNAEFVNGSARLAWWRLENKYTSRSAPNLLKLQEQYTESRLRKKAHDPDIWITQLEDMRYRLEEMGEIISNRQLIMKILNNLPEDYDIEVSQLEVRLGNTLDPLTVEDVRSAFNLKFERIQKRMREGKRDNDTEEHALIAKTV